MSKNIIAVDLGASSGRVILAHFDNEKITLTEIHRFKNELVKRNGQDCWDLEGLLREVKAGINLVLNQGVTPDSIGIDTWGVDFVLLDKQGQPLGDFVAYRDSTTQGIMPQFIADKMTRKDIYQITGLQFLPFNTIYQLIALKNQAPEWLSKVNRLLFIPDYLNYRLTGVEHCEYTNASTSQLLNCQTKQWSQKLLDLVDVPEHWFLPPELPNNIIGHYSVADQKIPVASIASHDTASAVVGAPLRSLSTAFLSSGTWSLMGIESFEPVINDITADLEITHEGGAEGRFRMLKNIMGLWLIQRLQAEFHEYSFPELVELASQEVPFRSLINPDDERFLNPESMSKAIQDFCREKNQAIPESVAQLSRCIYDSLALKYQHVFSQLQKINNRTLDSIHIIGGGANNLFLNQLCADVCQVPVQANPTEASALGNVVGQLIALGEVADVNAGREVIRYSFSIDSYQPRSINELDKILNSYQHLLRG